MLLVSWRFLAVIWLLCQPGNGDMQSSFLGELLKNYDVNESPFGPYNKPTEVRLQMYVNSFSSLNAANMDYTIDAYLRQMWRDPRLVFRSRKDTLTVTDPKIQNKIWKPDTFFINVKKAEIHKVTMPNILLRFNQTGHVLYSMRATVVLSCPMLFTDFPFDLQMCSIEMSSYANLDDTIAYKWVEEAPIDLSDDLTIAQFDLLKREAREMSVRYSTGNFSGLIVHLYLKRQNGFHILQTYIPTILIVAISWVSFWLDPTAIPGRVTLGVTTLLTLTTLSSGIRQQLPPVSYVKAIDVWIGMCMIMVFGALLEFTIANWLANKKIVEGKTVPVIPGLLGGNEIPSNASTYISYAKALDHIARVAFPAIFLIFNLFYWPYYLYKQYSFTY